MVLGALGGGLGAQRAPWPSQMHFRVRKPRSWLTPLGRFVVQFALFFAFVFVVFSRRPPERHLTDFYIILMTFREAFGEVFGDGS